MMSMPTLVEVRTKFTADCRVRDITVCNVHHRRHLVHPQCDVSQRCYTLIETSLGLIDSCWNLI